MAEMTLAQLSASLPRTRPSASREILLLVWLQQLPLGPQKATPPVLPSFGLSIGENEVPAGQHLPPEEDSWEWTCGCPPGQRGLRGWEWGSLYSSAQRPSLALCLEDSAWAHRNLGLGFRKPLPPRSLQSPLPSPVPLLCPLAPPAGAAWPTSTFSPSQPWGPAWHW